MQAGLVGHTHLKLTCRQVPGMQRFRIFFAKKSLWSMFSTRSDLGPVTMSGFLGTVTCWMQTCRLFGAELGKSAMTHFLKLRGDFHFSTIAGRIDSGWLSEERVKVLAENQIGGSSNLDEALTRAAVHLSVSLKHQVSLLSLADGFSFVAFVAALGLVAIGVLSWSPPLPTSNSKD